jgi:predicted CXXCH cytochrome family protein
MAVGIGCSVEKHHELLSVFFDGVPDPHAVQTDLLAAADGGPTMVSAHSAYLERRCEVCHGGGTKFSFSAVGFDQLNEETCLTCHEDVVGEHPHMHGPVAAQVCMACHVPHFSRHVKLLSAGSPELCLDCHTLQEPRSPAHEDLTRDCLTCHHGHGGQDPYMLRLGDEPDEEAGSISREPPDARAP